MNTEPQSSPDSEIVAVIAAAIAAVLDKPHRLLAVERIVMPDLHLNVWAFEGRVQLSMSHRIR